MAKTMSAFYDMPPWVQQMEKLHRQLEALARPLSFIHEDALIAAKNMAEALDRVSEINTWFVFGAVSSKPSTSRRAWRSSCSQQVLLRDQEVMGKGFRDAVAFCCRPDVAEPAAETACVDGHRVVAQSHVGLVVYGDECVAAGLPAFAGYIVPGRDERDDGDISAGRLL